MWIRPMLFRDPNDIHMELAALARAVWPASPNDILDAAGRLPYLV